MAKLTLVDITSGYIGNTTFNANNAAIEAALENTLSRDGTSPNQMGAALDMNSNAINNLPDAVNNQSPVTLAQAASIQSFTGVVATAGSVGAVLWPITAAETAAGVTPTNYYYEPGNALRYGVSTANVDNSSELQDAIDVAENGGGHVYIPAGSYNFTAGVTMPSYNNIKIYGDGPNATSLVIVGNSITLFLVSATAERIQFEDLWIGSFLARSACFAINCTGTSAAAVASQIHLTRISIQNVNNPLYFKWVHQSVIKELLLIQSVASSVTGVCLHMIDCISMRIRDVMTVVTTGTTGDDTVRIEGDCDTIVFTDSEIGGSAAIGLNVIVGAGSTGARLCRFENIYSESNTSAGFAITTGRDIRLSGCHAAVNGGVGFAVSGGDSVILDNCLALQNNLFGFYISGGTGTGLLWCTASDNSQTADNSYDGIRIGDNVTHCRLIGCRSGDFILSLTNDQAYGLTVTATGTNYIVVQGCDFQGNQSGDFQNLSTGANNSISNSVGFAAHSDGTTGGAASAGAGNQYIELEVNGTTYKVLHDGTV